MVKDVLKDECRDTQNSSRKGGIESKNQTQMGSLNPYRNQVIDEVAQEIEKFREPFGLDTTASFVIFVRNMKK